MEKKAGELVKLAERKAKSWVNIFGSGDKWEEAGELYEKAAALYIFQKEYLQSAESLLKYAECCEKTGSQHLSASAHRKAATSFLKCTPKLTERALRSLKYALDYHISENRFTMAAQIEEEIAELHAKNENIPTACEHFSNAARYFETESQEAHASKCWVRMAELWAEDQNYPVAAQLFEDVANMTLNSKFQLGAKQYFFKSVLCYLAANYQQERIFMVTNKLEEFNNLDPNFCDSREANFLCSVCATIEEKNSQELKNLVREYNSLKKFDWWMQTIFLAVFNHLESIELDLT